MADFDRHSGYRVVMPSEEDASPKGAERRQSSGRGDATGSLGRFRITALVVILLAAGLIAWLVLRDSGSESSGAAAATPAELQTLAARVDHPVFWLGPKDGMTYEVREQSNGTIFIRYLPSGAEVGTEEPHLTVATYPYAGAYAAVQAVTRQNGIDTIRLRNSGLAESSPNNPTSAHAAYPGVDYQAEVFDPAGKAASLVKGLKSLGTLQVQQPATAVTPAQLSALSQSLGHPIYWAGRQKATSYELTTTPNGQVTIRYLPKGKAPGASGTYLTIGTYPYANAFGAIQALAKESGARTIRLRNGGLAVVDTNANGRNIHLAYPGSNYQVEVFSPSARTARQVVEHRLVAID